YYDEVFSIPPMLDAIRAHPPVDGVIVGCFDDTGVDAARSMIDAPVIGICQAAMQTAAVIANSFSVVTTLARSVPALEHLADRYGYSRQCRGVWASEVPVLALEDPASDALQKVRAQIEATLAHDRCEAIVLGCGGMSDLAMRLTADYGVPVIEGVTCAVKILEGLAAIGHKTAKRGGYATPRAKQYTGRFESYSPG
ncbi:MAG: aspartate/glutamate racemase family protein, partial [Gammaproteobacteria bacterium]|nr:aspartate/glutamate racemase family protein [Gammaproteobacteria bacterium]